MRPIRLKMTAFGPYAKTVELDFEEGLAEEKIFLIHGETGAGKTSILDAICYALYDKSSGGDRTDKMLRCVHAASDTATEVFFKIFVRRQDFETDKIKNDGVRTVRENGGA